MFSFNAQTPLPFPGLRVGMKPASHPGERGAGKPAAQPSVPAARQRGVSNIKAVFNVTFLYRFWHRGILGKILNGYT